MQELYNLTMTQIVEMFVNEYSETRHCKKAEAKKLFLNALTFNVVANEVTEMMDCLKEGI